MRAPLLVLCLVAARVAAAQEVAPPPVDAAGSERPVDPPPPGAGQTDWTRHRHLGVFFRMTIGGGALSTTPSPSGAAAFSGGAASLSTSIGGAVAEDWILAADAWVYGAPAGKLGKDLTLGLSGLGLAVTHYFMPANVFVSFAPSITLVAVSDRYDEAVRQTQVGFGARFSVGKEWWVGDHWGIGVAVEGFFSSNHEQDSAQPIWTTVGGSLVFAATYN